MAGTYNCGGVDVVRAGAVDHRVEDDPVVVVRQLVGIPVLLFVLGLLRQEMSHLFLLPDRRCCCAHLFILSTQQFAIRKGIF